MAEGFKKGEMVKHKAGDVWMTVVDVKQEEDKTLVTCEWMEGNKPHQHTFDGEVLVKKKADVKPAPRIRVIR